MTERASTPSPHPEPGAADHDAVESVISEVRRALATIEFGSIVIKIHQGRVVGLETATKVRLDQ